MVTLPLLAGCLTDRTARETVWPPDDFRLLLRRVVPDAQVEHVRQEMSVGPDGLVVYRESPEGLVRPDGRGALPVFRRTCIYRMEPVSVRMLARELYRAKVLEVAPVGRDGITRGQGQFILLDWHAFGVPHTIEAGSERLVGFPRLLQIVNSYLPAGAEFTLPGVRTAPRPKRLELLPPVRDDLAGAYDAHKWLLAEQGRSEDLLVDLFALAVALGRTDDAQRWLAEGRNFAVNRQGPMGIGLDDGAGAGALESWEALALYLLLADPAGA